MGETRADSAGDSWLIEGLPADGPHPEYVKELSLFGQFVGDWSIVEWRNLDPDGSWSTAEGELHARWILGGRAVQEVYSIIDTASGRTLPLWTTLRFYDPGIDAWHCIWISPMNHAVLQFVAREVGREIVLDGENTRGIPIRWVFSEITHESFRWRAEQQQTSGSDWLMTEEMRLKRKPAT